MSDREKVFFSDLEKVVNGFLGLSRTQKAIRNYVWQLAMICDLLKYTHLLVVNKIEEIEKEKSLDEAKKFVQELENEPLTKSFRTKHLCDIFVGFGKELRKLIQPTDPEQEIPGITDEQKDTWRVFVDSLEEREGRVARLYANKLQHLGDLAYRSKTISDLENLKNAAKKAKKTLTSQMANFDHLANEFRKLQ